MLEKKNPTINEKKKIENEREITFSIWEKYA